VHEYGYSIEKRLKAKLRRMHKKNKKLYDAVMKSVEEITRKHPSGANQLLAMAKPWVVPIR
jgi:hypothetical protein